MNNQNLLGKKAFNIIHKEDINFLKKTVKERISGNKITETYTVRVRHKEGHFIWLESLTSPVYKGKKMNYFITSSRDVSEWVIAKKRNSRISNITSEINYGYIINRRKTKKRNSFKHT